MGEGCIPIRADQATGSNAAGFTGFNEVEIFSNHYWAMDQQEYLRRIVQAYRDHVCLNLPAHLANSTLVTQLDTLTHENHTRIGIIMNGVTGRMGTNQHLIRSILAIMQQGGVKVSDDLTLMPDPILTGRNEDKLRALAQKHGVAKYTTNLDAALADPAYEIFFDACGTLQRAGFVEKAVKARKAIYCVDPFDVAPVQARVELLGGPRRQAACRSRPSRGRRCCGRCAAACPACRGTSAAWSSG